MRWRVILVGFWCLLFIILRKGASVGIGCRMI
ncbi:unnamed protein product [Linum tenue]|uniref:Uncharacterized protein n=1 Tax=Linum tenue TaxID=586396 RepID=A0AAV0KW42_9ROSI|nr:unnamed protein product [Linum tenue]